MAAKLSLAGVSHATVSRALREHRAIAPDTIIQTMSERRVGGIIVCSGDVTAEHGHLLQQQGIPILAVFNAPNGQLNGGEASGDYFFNLPEPPTALMCFHDLMAIGLMHVIREKNMRSETIVQLSGSTILRFPLTLCLYLPRLNKPSTNWDTRLRV